MGFTVGPLSRKRSAEAATGESRAKQHICAQGLLKCGVSVPGAKSVAGTVAGRLSFQDELAGHKIVVRTVDGKQFRLLSEVAVAVGCGIVEHAEQADQGAVELSHPDCTAHALERVVQCIRPEPDVEFGDLEWPSPRSWSFLRCAAYLKVRPALEVSAAGAARVVVACHRHAEESSVECEFGAPPPGGLWGEAISNAIGTEELAAVRETICSSRALGARAANIAAAALVGAPGSPFSGAGTEVLVLTLSKADAVLAECPEFRKLEEAVCIYQATCPKEHRLNAFQTPNSTFFCDACSGSVAQDATLYGCWECNWDICSACRLRAAQADSVELGVALQQLAKTCFQGCAPIIAAALGRLWSRHEEHVEQALLLLEELGKPPANAAAAKGLASWLLFAGPPACPILPSLRARAVTLLGHLARPGDMAAARALVTVLHTDEEHRVVHEAAVSVLAYLVHRGDPPATEVASALARRLSDFDEDAQLVGLALLQDVAERGHEDAVKAVVACLAARSDIIRERAVDVLRALAGICGEAALAAEWAALSCGPPALRATAVAALGAVSGPGSFSASAKLAKLLKDKEPLVRDIALAELGRVASRQCLDAGDAVRELLNHKNWSVRKHALGVFARVASCGTGEAAKVVVSKLQDSSAGVRDEVPAALELLAQTDLQEHAAAHKALLGCLRSEKWIMRSAALAALAKVAAFSDECRPDEDAVAAVAAMVTDEVKSVRDQAVSTLENLLCTDCDSATAMGSAALVASLLSKVRHRDPSVRASVLQALGRVAPRGHQGTLEATKVCLGDTSWAVREKAVATFARLADLVDVDAPATLAAHLEDPTEVVRAVAAIALVMLAEAAGEATSALAEARKRLDHPGQGVRRSASVAVVKLTTLQARQCKLEIGTDDPNSSYEAKNSKARLSTYDGIQDGMRQETGVQLKDCVSRGLRHFLTEAKHGEGIGIEAKEDEVTQGLRLFLLEQQRRMGPISPFAMAEEEHRKHRRLECPTQEIEVFRPPQLMLLSASAVDGFQP